MIWVCAVAGSVENAVEHKQKYYRMCGRPHLEVFAMDPERFAGVGPDKQLPPNLPFRVTYEYCARIEAANCELLGHCPVTLLQAQARGFVLPLTFVGC